MPKLNKTGSMMTKSVVTISPDSNVIEAVKLMRDNRLTYIVVVSSNLPVGIITEQDIVKMVANGESFKKPVSETMSHPLITASPGTLLKKALNIMRTNHIRRLPIIKNGYLVGLVTETHLLVASGRAMVEIEQKQHKMENLAMKDKLTGLYNRRYFHSVMKKELSRARRYGALLSLILIDIDYFKKINDTFGHSVGDAVLKKLSKIFKDSARKVDIVFRYGGDEFAIVCPISGTRSARIFAERLRKTIEKKQLRYNGNKLVVTISAGICKYTSVYSSIEKIVEGADEALYLAKQNGRNQVCVAEE
ncbi:MAG: GGDEF domain-containing protein [bacterium]|nr:GGDEF domain-containing protein [bacterium]